MESNSTKKESVVVTQYHGKKYNCALLIPVINESLRISAQLQKMDQDYSVDLIIVDGGSHDSTIREVTKFSNKLTAVIEIAESLGLSHQLRVGFEYCLSMGYEHVITMDGNDKDDFKGVSKILNALEKGYDFVQGSRFIKGGEAVNTPLKRLLGIRLIHAPLTSFFAKKIFTDTTNGFRGHSRKLLEMCRFDRDIFETYELLAYIPIKAGKLKLKCTEVPVARRYPQGKIPTKINSLYLELRLLGILIKAGIGKYD
jgi:dolichol-phosphate mannosyltransferase